MSIPPKPDDYWFNILMGLADDYSNKADDEYQRMNVASSHAWSEAAKEIRLTAQQAYRTAETARMLVEDGWTCHVCGQRRPDDKISVEVHDLSDEKGFPWYENVRYCNDRESCQKGASQVRFSPRSNA